jgi:hypothetical protein
MAFERLWPADAVCPVAGMFMTSQATSTAAAALPYKAGPPEEVRTEFRKQGVWLPHAEVVTHQSAGAFSHPS